jgi:MFS family permease
MSEFLAKLKKDRFISGLFEVNVLNAFHYILVVYINSSFLKLFIPASSVSILFTLSAVVSLVAFLLAPHIIKSFGNFRFFTVIIIAEILSLLTLALSSSATFAIAGFFVHYVSVYMIFYSLDVFFESAVKNENETGILRGIYLTLANTAIVLGPALVSILAANDNYRRVYIVSALVLLPMIVLAWKRFRGVTIKDIPHVEVGSTIKEVWQNRNIFRIVSLNFLLQFFFAWMVVYTPVFLHEVVGFSWSVLGIMFSIMLIPFILFELPAGRLADTRYGEKEILSLGFLIAIAATFTLSILTSREAWIWTLVLFLTRVGASLIEIGSDTYFFKQVTESNANVISAYRGVIPLAFIIAPIIFFISENLLGFANSFIVLAGILALGFLSIIPLKDTR